MQRKNEIINALKPWLVIQVRVKDRPLEAAEYLKDLSEDKAIRSNEKALILAWMSDLQIIAHKKPQSPKAWY